MNYYYIIYLKIVLKNTKNIRYYLHNKMIILSHRLINNHYSFKNIN